MGMSRSVALQQPGSGLMSVVPVATEGSADAQGLSVQPPETMLVSEGHVATKAIDLGGLCCN